MSGFGLKALPTRLNTADTTNPAVGESKKDSTAMNYITIGVNLSDENVSFNKENCL
jgi:hypothetical protein